MADLEKLVRDHAYWADKVREIRRQGQEAGLSCSRLKDLGPFQSADTCIDVAVQELRTSDPHDELHFEEVWDDMLYDGEICNACISVRQLKAERIYAAHRLGAIRAAITRVGRALNKEQS